eukprot:jgi/Hompol1/597/HPOL_005377-RA
MSQPVLEALCANSAVKEAPASVHDACSNIATARLNLRRVSLTTTTLKKSISIENAQALNSITEEIAQELIKTAEELGFQSRIRAAIDLADREIARICDMQPVVKQRANKRAATTSSFQ